MLVLLRDLWWKYSCFDFERYEATINAASAFCLLWFHKAWHRRGEFASISLWYHEKRSKWCLMYLKSNLWSPSEHWHLMWTLLASQNNIVRCCLDCCQVFLLCPPPIQSTILKIHKDSICCRTIVLNCTQIVFYCMCPPLRLLNPTSRNWNTTRKSINWKCFAFKHVITDVSLTRVKW